MTLTLTRSEDGTVNPPTSNKQYSQAKATTEVEYAHCVSCCHKNDCNVSVAIKIALYYYIRTLLLQLYNLIVYE